MTEWLRLLGMVRSKEAGNTRGHICPRKVVGNT